MTITEGQAVVAAVWPGIILGMDAQPCPKLPTSQLLLQRQSFPRKIPLGCYSGFKCSCTNPFFLLYIYRTVVSRLYPPPKSRLLGKEIGKISGHAIIIPRRSIYNVVYALESSEEVGDTLPTSRMEYQSVEGAAHRLSAPGTSPSACRLRDGWQQTIRTQS